MKFRIVIMVIIMVSAATVMQAQQALKFKTMESRLAYAQKNMALGLRSENPGVVESTMMLVAKMKMIYPSVSIAALLPIIDSIVVAGASPSLRYKAYLVSNICSLPSWFAADRSLETLQPDLFYNSAALRLQQKMLDIGSL